MIPMQETTGEYGIRSVYFDNLEDKALREKLDGVNNRENSGFGITTASFPISHWKKSKRDGLCSKKETASRLRKRTGCSMGTQAG